MKLQNIEELKMKREKSKITYEGTTDTQFLGGNSRSKKTDWDLQVTEICPLVEGAEFWLIASKTLLSGTLVHRPCAGQAFHMCALMSSS